MRKKTLELDRSYLAWAGSRQDLLTLGKVMEAQFEDEKKGAMEEYEDVTKRLDAEVANAPRTDDRQVQESLNRALQTERNSAARSRDFSLELTQAKLTVTDQENEEVVDRLDDFVNEADFKYASRVRLTCSSWRSAKTCYVSFRNTQHGSVSLSVSGQTPWVRAAFAAIDKELRKGQPWWRFVRHGSASFIASLIGASIVGIVGSRLFNASAGILVALFLVVPSMLAYDLTIFRLFPAIEIQDEGLVSRRKKLSRALSLGVGGFVALVAFLQAVTWLTERL